MWIEEELRQLIAHGETTTVELKVAPPRSTELRARRYQYIPLSKLPPMDQTVEI